jgi:hypothetical protein
MSAASGQALLAAMDLASRARGVRANMISAGASQSQAGRVQRLNPIMDGQWDGRLPDCSIFNRKAWVTTLQRTYGFDPNYFATSAGEHLNTLLPVMEIDSWLTGRRGVSLPFTDYCEPLAGDEPAFQQLFDAALTYGRDRRWKYFELRGGQQFLSSAQPSQQYYGHEIVLRGDENAVYAALKPPVRRAIRKAEKQGLTVEILEHGEGVKEFYSLHCRTRRKHGLPPQPFAFFQNLQKYILEAGSGIIIVARLGARAVAGSVFFHTRQQALYKYGASDEKALELRGNDLVMWQGIKYYVARGFRTLHLGRTSLTNEGLRRFKLGWGAREHAIKYFKYDLRESAFVTDRDQSVGWYNRAFAAMPLSLARFLGAVLYRHVA